VALQRVRVVLQAPLAPFEFGVVHEVFGVDRTDDGVPAFDYQVCTENPGSRSRSAVASASRPVSTSHRAPTRTW
jgi:AraC family transcriptional activator FtrA